MYRYTIEDVSLGRGFYHESSIPCPDPRDDRDFWKLLCSKRNLNVRNVEIVRIEKRIYDSHTDRATWKILFDPSYGLF